MTDLALPLELWEDAGDDTEALMEAWNVAVGDQVSAGQVLATAVIVKTTVELTAPSSGVVAEILVAAGDTFPRGATLARLDAATAATTPAAPQPTAAAPAAAAAAPRLIPFSGMRGSIARNLSQAWQAPRVAAGIDVDMSAAQAHLAALRAASGRRITLTTLFVRAAALTLRAHPQLNALVYEHGVEPRDEINIALAVSLADGLVTPVIRNADQLSAADIAAQIEQLADAARAGSSANLQGGTFTISNLGGTGINWFTPVLNPPQAAILGVARVVETAVVRNGSIVAAPITTLTLVFDHRAVDGEPAGRFLAALRDQLQEPAAL
jgi:pyruvate/2-oxoglutarate dehydrogenase complex dihydrolipoamide acyltransferase (E2) component